MSKVDLISCLKIIYDIVFSVPKCLSLEEIKSFASRDASGSIWSKMLNMNEVVFSNLVANGAYKYNNDDSATLDKNREMRPPYLTPGGNFYHGEWIVGTDIKEGKGRFIWADDGDIYEGWWKQDQYSIRGREIQDNG